jgi:hypothetical protein
MGGASADLSEGLPPHEPGAHKGGDGRAPAYGPRPAHVSTFKTPSGRPSRSVEPGALPTLDAVERFQGGRIGP